MAEKNKLPSELDDKIQGLAGDIYLHIEEKVAGFILANQQIADVTPKQVEQPPLYQTLSERIAELEQESTKNQQSHDKQHNKNLAVIASLEQKNSDYQQTIKNSAELNEAKLTDTESVLKTKLTELSELEKQLSKIEKLETSQRKKLEQSDLALTQLKEQLAVSSDELQSLQKNDQAKSATIDVQNRKVSELNDQVNTLGAELEQAKTEQKNSVIAASADSSDNQKQLFELNEGIRAISEQLSNEKLLSKNQKEQLVTLNSELDESKQQCRHLTEEMANQLVTSKKSQQHNDAQLQNEQQSIVVLKKSQANYQKNIGELKATIAQSEINFAQRTKAHEQNQQVLQEKITQLNEEAEQAQQQQTDLIDQLTESQQQTKLAQQNIDNLHEKQLKLTNEITQQQESITEEKQRFIDEHNHNLQTQKEANEKLAKLNKRLNSGEERQAASAQALIQLQQSYDNLAISFEQAKQEVERQVSNVTGLEQEISDAKVRNVQAQQRAETNRGKQESEYNKARETIKYLRDENSELNKQLEQQVSELETKLTEYRLRFEYAQKQLTKQ